MNILGIILARRDSKGLPNKNKLQLGSLPLVAHTFLQAKKSSKLKDVILSTDDTDIINIANDYGIEVPFIRPSNLALDTTPSLDVIKHSLEVLQKGNRYFDAICLLQPTSPYRPDGIIDFAINKFEKYDYDSLVSIREIPCHYNPQWSYYYDGNLISKVVDNEFNRRQDLPKAYHRDGAIYLSLVSNIMDHNRIIGPKCGAIEINSPELINIDSWDDFRTAEKYFK